MPRLCANLTLLFNEVDFPDRFALAAQAGFKGVEFLFPYPYDRADLARRLADQGLTQVLFNLPAGDWAAGERGIGCLPDRVDEFRAGVEKALEYAQALNCTRINCLAGLAPEGVERERLSATLAENLAYAAECLRREGVTLLVEPINTRDIPGFFLTHTRQGLDLIEASGSANVKLQYDIYHMQVMEGDLARTIETHLPAIGHMQLADNPGRNEPGTGEINYPFLLDFIDRAGYQGWIGCEYRPKAGTREGLGWAAPWLGAH